MQWLVEYQSQWLLLKLLGRRNRAPDEDIHIEESSTPRHKSPLKIGGGDGVRRQSFHSCKMDSNLYVHEFQNTRLVFFILFLAFLLLIGRIVQDTYTYRCNRPCVKS